MRLTQRSLRLGLALLVVCAAWPVVQAQATYVFPEGELFQMENVGAVTFVTNSTPQGTITCAGARITDLVPRPEVNPNAGGSVFDGIRVEGSNSAAFTNCNLVGARIPALSGGISGVPNVAWNYLAGIPIATMSFPRPAFLWTNSDPERGTCFITIGRFPVQAMIGRWTNGFPSTVRFERQNLIADTSGPCPFGSFSQVQFTGTFRVSAQPSGFPVIVEL